MKLLITGYEPNKKVITASSYLVDKYLSGLFDVYWLNYGPFDGKLFCGEYKQLADKQEGMQNWSRYLKEYLTGLNDKFIILGMDDMLLSSSIDLTQYYDKLLSYITMADNIVCAKLCTSDFHKPEEYEMIDKEVMVLNPNALYSAVGQYALWNREFLIWLLEQTTDPFSFEGEGSKIINASGKKIIGTKKATIPYPDRSSMSRSWPGKIKVVGNPKKDIDYLLENGYLNKEDLLYE